MVEVNNLTKTAIPKSFLEIVAKKVLIGENKVKECLSIAVVDRTEMEKLNSCYRGKKESTDVLAFCENYELGIRNYECSGLKNQIGMGEVVICLEKIKENAEKYNVDFRKELARALIHGILHLMGYDHEKSTIDAEKMKEREDYYSADF